MIIFASNLPRLQYQLSVYYRNWQVLKIKWPYLREDKKLFFHSLIVGFMDFHKLFENLKNLITTFHCFVLTRAVGRGSVCKTLFWQSLSVDYRHLCADHSQYRWLASRRTMRMTCSQVFNSVFTGQFSTDLSDGWPGAKKYNLFEEIYWLWEGICSWMYYLIKWAD